MNQKIEKTHSQPPTNSKSSKLIGSAEPFKIQYHYDDDGLEYYIDRRGNYHYTFMEG